MAIITALAIIFALIGFAGLYRLVDQAQEQKIFRYLDHNHRQCKVCGEMQHRMYPEMELWAGSKTECVCKKYLT